jgi:secreted PhoX family phosphatase
MAADAPTISEILAQAVSRRRLLKHGVALGALGLLNACQPARAPISPARLKHPAAFDWAEVPHGSSDEAVVPEGWRLERLAATLPTTTGMICLSPGAGETEEALLWLSHGAGLSQKDRASDVWMRDAMRADGVGREALQRMIDKAQTETGGRVLPLGRQDGIWRILHPHPLARSITMRTAITLRGPAAGNPRLQTETDPRGTEVLGMLSAGAVTCTPWGTVLVGEGDIHRHFRFPTDATEAGRLPEGANHVRMRLHDDGWHRWGELDARFDARRTPNEPNRFGWVVEIDPHQPSAPPVKHTALGRFRHAGIACLQNVDGRVVVYMSDGDVGEYLYRFVSARTLAQSKASTLHVLDVGELSVARFDAMGLLQWIPLRHGQGVLTAERGFASEADVLIEARRAADLVGATRLDAAMGLTTQSGRVYVALNGNDARAETDAVHSQAPNLHGQLLELIAPTRRGGFDHAGSVYDWSIVMQGGNPAKPEDHSFYLARMEKDSWLSRPGALSHDKQGHAWLVTAGMEEQTKHAEKLYAVALRGPWRGRPHSLLRAPSGAQIAGPAFMPDGKTVLVSVPERQEILTISKANSENIFTK